MRQKNNQLILIPYAWLGNRIRAISAAHAFAEQYNRKLKIIWLNHDNGMNLPFYEIFEKPEMFEVVELKSKLSGFIFHSLSKLIKALKLKAIKNYTAYIDLNEVDENVIRDPNNLVIKTCSRFYRFENIPLKFRSTITQAGDQFLDTINGDYIGMHIRRGDNIKSIEKSPLELFIDVARDEVYKNNKKLLLCTDDSSVKKTFKEIFGGKVFTRDINLGKSSADVIDAAIDMYCLSKAQKIYGSYFSSFSTISAEFNRIPLVRLQTQ